MNRKHEKTLQALYTDPVRANIAWKDVESLFRALDAEITEAEGSRVEVVLNGVRAVFHEPHPQKEIKKWMVRDIRDFFDEAGVAP